MLVISAKILYNKGYPVKVSVIFIFDLGFTRTANDSSTYRKSAYEKEDSSFINKTSYIENCETSAVGRALGFVGIGVDNDIASAQEVLNAEQQQAAEKPITKIMVKALEEKCKSDDVDMSIILQLCKVEKFEDIKCKVYSNLVNNWDKVLEKNVCACRAE